VIVSTGVGQRLQQIHDCVGDEPLLEWLEQAACGPAVKHLAHLAMRTADVGGNETDWRAWVRDNVPEATDKLLAEAVECMRGAGLWPWPS
jgi:hypothetical protein